MKMSANLGGLIIWPTLPDKASTYGGTLLFRSGFTGKRNNYAIISAKYHYITLNYSFMKHTLLITISLSLILQICSAQKSKIGALNHFTKRMGISYDVPPRFQEVIRPDTMLFKPTKREYITSISYTLRPKDADVILALSFYDLDETGWIGQGPAHNYNDNNQMTRVRYLIGLPPTSEEKKGTFEMNLDTNKVRFFNETELKKYGATYGGIANIPMDKLYMNHYKMLRLLFFFKKGKGEVYQYYFYNDSILLDKTMRNSKYMLTFKE
jgi:hypothetical protein